MLKVNQTTPWQSPILRLSPKKTNLEN
jgi:hypothetical protein